MKLVIIGGGVAAFEAANAARKFSSEVEITMISNEKVLPYRRPALSGEALEASQMVVKRLCPNTLMSLAKAPLNDRKMNIIPDTLYILMDGKRSVFDAVKLYEYEFDEDKYTEEKLRKLMDYLRYLEKYGYIEITAL